MKNELPGKRPTFFIVGAPKCGTSTLAQWLGEHNNIFMCNPKEPHHFNTDSKHRFYVSRSDYEDLFDSVDLYSHRAIGEASVWYLLSDTAIRNIISYQPQAKIIVCLRNPIEACVSLHDQKYFSGDETIKDFKKAWIEQEYRKQDPARVPPTCVDVRELLYGESCKFAYQLKKLETIVPKENLKVILLDDMKSNPKTVYEDILDFLSIESDSKSNFEVVNPAKRRHFVKLTRIQRRIALTKQFFGIKKGTGLGNYLNKINRSTRKRDSIDESLKNELIDFFYNDIKQLEKILHRDLEHWLQPKI